MEMHTGKKSDDPRKTNYFDGHSELFKYYEVKLVRKSVASHVRRFAVGVSQNPTVLNTDCRHSELHEVTHAERWRTRLATRRGTTLHGDTLCGQETLERESKEKTIGKSEEKSKKTK